MNKPAKSSANKAQPKKSTAVKKVEFQNLDPFFNEISRDDDFARIVVGGAKVDTCLVAILDKFLVDGSTKDGLLSHSGTVGNFAARAALCYTLGLISKIAYTDMMTLANLRNISAHHPSKVSFKDEHVQEKIRALKWLDAWVERNYGSLPNLESLFAEQYHQKYNLTIGLMCYELNRIAGGIEKREQYEEPPSSFHMKLKDAQGRELNKLSPHLEERKRKANEGQPNSTLGE